MKIKPLIQLREMISKALSGQTNLSKTFQSFFIETMELILTHTGRLNFTQLARCGRSCESRFRQNFRKSFDWLSFNRSFLESTKGHRIAIAIDPCYISKSGKKTYLSSILNPTAEAVSSPKAWMSIPSAEDENFTFFPSESLLTLFTSAAFTVLIQNGFPSHFKTKE